MSKLLRFLEPYRWLLVAIIILAVGQASANLYLPNLMSDIVNKGIAASNTNFILQTGGWMVLVAIGGTVFAIIGVYLASLVATGMSKSLRAEIFAKIQQFSLHEFNVFGTASLITRTTNDTTQIQQVMVMILSLIITAPITLVVGTILALDQDVKLAWTLIAIMPALIGLIIFLLIKAVPLFTEMQKRIDKLNLIINEKLVGVRVIRAFNRNQYEEARFDLANHNVTDVAIKVNQVIATMMPVMMFLINISSISIIWFGSHRVAGGHLEIGAMFAFLQYAMQILFSLLMVALLFIMIPRAEASAKRIFEVLDTDPTIKDPKTPNKSFELHGQIEFQNVTFTYEGAENPAISNISFIALPGKVTAILGGTGSGKSALVNLIPRFYDVTKGKILVDGIDVREMSQVDLRSRIGYISQKAKLFSGTIKDNLRFGRENATDEEIYHAATVAQASEFIANMPDTYDSFISEGGTNVSGGQKQRLSIARALVLKPEIYVFDDTFSALDFKTDAKLRAALKKETQNSTVIIVAQRISTVLDADQIIVLEDGKMAGIGTHGELMKSNRVYQNIARSQLSEDEIKKEIL
ncbi:MAG: putative ABC transporter ATP-binding protein [Bacteroidetes bacterium ADurb.Bin302]|nr:MAG: putative ABC transporter ATP-binding protein [Bacteroidetes bacterium ADurb.Bin302]